MDLHKLDHKVPIPNRHRNGKWAEIMPKVRHGSSIIVLNSERNSIYMAARRAGFRTVQRRKTKDSIRVWFVNPRKRR